LNFIVFEYIRGENIRDIVERHGPLPLSDAISYTLQLAEALAHASQRKVVHRDIKPSNIIITEEGRAKLVDMGLARLHARTANDDLTASGVTLGTFDYISPEQARDPRVADVRSDIYSLGCTLYYMFTARPPFPEGTVLQKLLQHQGDEVPDPRGFNSDLPADVTPLVRRMLAKDPRKRFQDPGELIAELLLLADRLHLRPVTTGQFWIAPRDDRPALWERHLPWAAPVALLLAIVAILEWSGRSSSLSLSEVDVVRQQEVKAIAGSSGAPAALAPGLNEDVQAEGTEAPLDTTAHSDDVPPRSRTTREASAAQSARSGANQRLGDDAFEAPHEVDAASSDLEQRPVTGAAPAGELADQDVDPRSAVPAELATLPRSDAETVPETFNREALTANRDSLDEAPDVAPGAVETAAASVTQRASSIAILPTDVGERRKFATLKAACAVARNNDVVELAYNGPRDEDPFELVNLKVTIRAAEGFRPVVAFRPERLGLSGFARSMITISGGRLTLLNVGLLLDVPRDATAEGWSLVETRQAEQLRLEGCTLTVRNASANGDAFHDRVSFFDIKAMPGVDTMMKMADAPPIHPVDLELQNCLARGEAVFVHSPDAQPVTIDWDNGLLATTEEMFLGEGTPATLPSSERVEMHLNHLTAVAQQGLIRLVAASDAPHLLKTEVSCENSFLVTRGAPLVEQQGPLRTAMLEQQFQWSGDHNFCQGFTVFWQLVDLNTPTVPRLVSWPQWQAHWGDRGDSLLPPRAQIWKRTGLDDRPMHTLRRDDFVLADRSRGSESPYVASDTGEAGMQWRKLPELPQAASPPPSRTRAPRSAAGNLPAEP
jgi:serine/threonine-protein kinase